MKPKPKKSTIMKYMEKQAALCAALDIVNAISYLTILSPTEICKVTKLLEEYVSSGDDPDSTMDGALSGILQFLRKQVNEMKK